MNREEAKQAILDRYPKIFPVDPERGTRIGFACDKGWFPIIDHLCATVQDYIDNTGVTVVAKDGETLLLNPPQLVFDTIKEKLGTGRFYERVTAFPAETVEAVDGATLERVQTSAADKFDGMILFAEHLTSVTCEKCGKPGEIMNRNGFLATRCPACAKREGFKSRPDQGSPSTRLTITPERVELRGDGPQPEPTA